MTSLQYRHHNPFAVLNKPPALEVSTEAISYQQYYDSTEIEALKGAQYVTLYGDGVFNEQQYIDDFPHVRLITNFGDQDEGILDYEPGSPLYGDILGVRNWLIAREKMDRRSRVYCDRNDCRDLAPHISDLNHKWVIATLDNFPWTQAQLLNEMLTNFDTRIEDWRLWGNQWKPAAPGGPFRDQSSLYLEW